MKLTEAASNLATAVAIPSRAERFLGDRKSKRQSRKNATEVGAFHSSSTSNRARLGERKSKRLSRTNEIIANSTIPIQSQVSTVARRSLGERKVKRGSIEPNSAIFTLSTNSSPLESRASTFARRSLGERKSKRLSRNNIITANLRIPTEGEVRRSFGGRKEKIHTTRYGASIKSTTAFMTDCNSHQGTSSSHQDSSDHSSGTSSTSTYLNVSFDGTPGSLNLDATSLIFSPDTGCPSEIWRWTSIQKPLVRERSRFIKIVLCNDYPAHISQRTQSIVFHVPSHEELKRLMREIKQRIRKQSNDHSDMRKKNTNRSFTRPSNLVTYPLANNVLNQPVQTAGQHWPSVEPADESDLEEAVGLRSDEGRGQPFQPMVEPANARDALLVTANPVEDLDLTTAELWDGERETQAAEERSRKSRRTAMTCFCVGLAIVIFGAAFLAGVVVHLQNKENSKDKDLASSLNPSSSPSAAPTVQGDYILQLLPNYTLAAILQRGTPQEEAFDWLLSDPAWMNYSDSRLVQRFALATLFFATGGDISWYQNAMDGSSDWLSPGTHECDWKVANISSLFIDRDGNQKYILGSNACVDDVETTSRTYGDGLYKYLWLPSNGLAGTLPPEVYLLSSLQILNLDGNSMLKGTFSSHIGMLTELRAMSLSSTGLTGSIPEALKYCSNLEAILLDGVESSNVKFTGGIPSELGQLGRLQHLWLEHSGVSSFLPSELGSLSLLETCYMKGNQLTGTLPSEVELMGSLQDLDLTTNNLRGAIPSGLGGLVSFTALQLGDNSLTGSLPSQLGLLTNLQFFSAHLNELTGQLPTDLGSLVALKSLALQMNHLTGPLPTEFGQLQLPRNFTTGEDLTFFWLNDNQLTGYIPTEMGLLGDIANLRLQGNSLNGPVPSELGQLSHLGELWLQGNYLSGLIPSEIGLLDYSYLLLLDGNNLTGTMPNELGNILYLEELSLSENSLTGTIPLEISQLPYLAYFNVAGNDLSGEVPVFDSVVFGSFQNATYLSHRTINLTLNSFSGEVPFEMCILTDGFLQFDCNELLCGCWCSCPFANTSSISNSQKFNSTS